MTLGVPVGGLMPNHDRPLNCRTHEGIVVKLMYPPGLSTVATWHVNPEPAPIGLAETVLTGILNPVPGPSGAATVAKVATVTASVSVCPGTLKFRVSPNA